MAEESPLQWVERLLEPSVEETMMTKAARVLSQSHYSDVVEERNIGRLCGYPLCGNPLGEQPRQKYHISLAQKKVFDLTQRKKFCSGECFRASNYYASQLSDLPLAVTDGNRSVAIKLLSPCGRTMSADGGNTSTNTTTASSSADESKLLDSGDIKERVVTAISSEEYRVLQTASQLETLNVSDDEEKTHDTHLTPPKVSSASRLLHAMSSWCTPETWQLLTSARQDPVRSSALEGDKAMLHKQETALGENQVEHDLGASVREGLRAEGREDNDESVVLPPVHSSAHSHLQMTIFVQQLKRNIPSVASQLGFNVHEILHRIMALVHTFRFTRHTVTFKPAEWKVIIVILLHKVNPKSEVQSTVIQKWMRSIDATENDFKLMLNCFEVSHQVG